ncbi:CoA-binding domain-containing protein [Calderihabitans maritimus]|uniref:CoA-binding domain-containing protein n=1 Tax=Calderihabitans maritimus TaxID=1246530 RepID=A0A1Z5HUF4_9FIRM|nr:CoA-binding domain-containing protein [Calderihabitans maritimus]
MGYSIFNLAQEAGIGFTYIVSTGNEVDLHSLELLEYMVEDPDTRLLISYFEGIKDGRRFAEVAERALELGKPIVALKVGKTEVGQKAASSHTASMTGSETVFGAFFKQKGIIRVNDIEEILDIAYLYGRIPLPTGKGLGVVTTSGGAGILVADAAVEMGLSVPELDESVRAKINQVIPDYGSALNPVDVTAQVINDPQGFIQVLEAMLENPAIDALVIVVTMIAGAAGERLARDIVEVYRRSSKPVVVAWTAGDRLMENCFAILRKGDVPYFKSPVRCVKALGALMKYSAFRQEWLHSRTGVHEEVAATTTADLLNRAREILENTGDSLTEHEGKMLLAHYGIPVTEEEVVTTPEEALAVARRIGYPVAVKIDSPDILHKTEAKAIKLGISSDEQLLAAYREVLENARNYQPEARIDGVLIQEMVSGGTEVIVGMKNDSQFGPVLVFGLGGIFVEILKDVVLRVAPITRDEAYKMISSIKGYKILEGARGREPGDLKALAEVLVKVGQLAVDLGDVIGEIDINPLLVLPRGQGVKAVDALVIKK